MQLSKKERKKMLAEKQREQSKQALAEHQEREERFKLEDEKKAKTKRKIVVFAVVAIIVIVAVSAYAIFSPGKYDDFAKCLTEKGAVMYGEDWCQYTNGQKAMFGRSFKHVNYEVKKDLRLRPTWVIDGETYETVQSFQRLSELTGCKI